MPIVSIKIVDNYEDAISHIEKYSSGHTESIISEDMNVAAKFQKDLDSAIVMHNASTQFADGGEFGFGGEMALLQENFMQEGLLG